MQKSSFQQFTYLKSANADYIDEMLQRYLANPSSVDDSWRFFFEGIAFGMEAAPSPETYSNGNGHAVPAAVAAPTSGWEIELKVVDLIQAYREKGKWLAEVDPLSPPESSYAPLELSAFGLGTQDLERTFAAGRLLGLGSVKLKDILQLLKDSYCRTVACEITQVSDPKQRDWLLKRIEVKNAELDLATKTFILKRLSRAETFERFLHTRYVAQKRFSVEGAENVIPAIDSMLEAAAEAGVVDAVIGMAHRGRLNVLHNLFGKKAESMFTEFEGNYQVDTSHGEGDVKYHKGYSADAMTRQGKPVHLSLAFNPSHLEFVNATTEGMVRAKQDLKGDHERKKVLPILIHGDAAFAGQGVCYETLNMARLAGYRTGGTIHIVINNQVGFTTDPIDARSTPYCTDAAKMLDAPIFHVNGDDAEAVWKVSKLAAEFRQTFGDDVFIDLVAYRKYGHNEGDEPTFTQPLLYKKIKVHPSPREVYAARLADTGTITGDAAQAMVDSITADYLKAQATAKEKAPYDPGSTLQGTWKGFHQAHGDSEIFQPAQTSVDEATLKKIAEAINSIPKGFQLHPKLGRFFEARLKAVHDGKGLDWGNAETLAYATLVAEGHPVRLSGQDAERGTFTHRHSVLSDYETGEKFTPINQAACDLARYEVRNSLLSETAVMGFEYGYSLANPNALVLWEGQFGDFANGAQVIIDQFIATGESKWNRMSGLVLLLPHGYEGQGPEHSSARLERFLQLSARQNIQVANLSTPAQIFHALRRQVKRDFRKPLIIMSPKSLLRLADAVSSVSDLTQGSFQEVIDDPAFGSGQNSAQAGGATRVLLCSGKVYYDLVRERTAKSRGDVAIVRVEQLYPWPAATMEAILARYPRAKDIVWVQEEPRNMGAWTYVFDLWAGGTGEFSKQAGGREVRYVGRPLAAAPATGYLRVHEAEQHALIEESFK